jgi:hypothetical protein
MDIYTLTRNGCIITEDSLTVVLRELMKIARQSECMPEITYDINKNATRFEFEESYINTFNVYLSRKE